MEEVTFQLLQPAFFYSAVLLAVSFISILLLFKINGGLNSRWRSYGFLIPLTIPLAVLILFSGDLLNPIINGMIHQLSSGVTPPTFPRQFAPPSALGMPIAITELAMIAGAAFCLVSISTSLLTGDRVIRRLLRVIDLGPEDYPEIQANVTKLAEQMCIPAPRIGLVEDLRPNAFTYGSSKKATVVFSLGLLELLDDDEIRGVIAHELAHIKNDDVMFKVLTRGLALLSFFNPLSYLVMRAARREREELADQMAKDVIGDDSVLLRAIEKVTSILRGERDRGNINQAIGMSFALSLSEGTALLATHPSFSDRVRSIKGERVGRIFSPQVCAILSVLVIVTAFLLVLALGDVRAEIIHSTTKIGMGPIPISYSKQIMPDHIPASMGAIPPAPPKPPM